MRLAPYSRVLRIYLHELADLPAEKLRQALKLLADGLDEDEQNRNMLTHRP
ncbi:MAG TPA: hypothetical protein H9824_00745 [Candidatus Bacteroides pullicola]|uniref:Uncharacterized protein n=1 Tax=Candidatus Bacteroides pullicola TaxID=2838475 RepID=A0A9D2CKM0_9BACE|nr:hypothetical protein [Candidatus Bacteroides pullicola]